MNKKLLTSIINKYHLNGIIDPAIWKVSEEKVSINFISPNKDIFGRIESDNFKIEDSNIAIFDTSKLLKLINIVDQLLILKLKKEQLTPSKLLISDKKYDLEYSLADVSFIPKTPKVNEPKYEIIFDINEEFLNKFIKAKKAIESEIFTICTDYTNEDGNVVKIILGDTSEYSNKINFTTPIKNIELPISPKIFPLSEIKEIFEANKESNGVGYISEQGLLKIEFKSTSPEGEINSLYYIVAKT